MQTEKLVKSKLRFFKITASYVARAQQIDKAQKDYKQKKDL